MSKKQADKKIEPEKIKKKRNKRTRKVKQKYIPQKALFGTAEDYYVYAMNAGKRYWELFLDFARECLYSWCFSGTSLFLLLQGRYVQFRQS